MARSSTGTAASSGVYTTLFDPATDGSWAAVLIWVTSGTATLKIGGLYEGSNVLTLDTNNGVSNPFPIAPTTKIVGKIEAAGSGGSATVAFAGIS